MGRPTSELKGGSIKKGSTEIFSTDGIVHPVPSSAKFGKWKNFFRPSALKKIVDAILEKKGACMRSTNKNIFLKKASSSHKVSSS